MSGTLALLGGQPFSEANQAIDRDLLAAAGATAVVVIPTADAFEHPKRQVEAATAYFGAMGVAVEGLMVLNRMAANDAANVAALAEARFVYLAGDNQLHQRSSFKDTPLLDAVLAVLDRGGVVAAAGGAAAGLCDPMVDLRGGAFTLGLGVCPGMAVITDAETWPPERLKRSLELAANFTVAVAPSGAALLRRSGGWSTVGNVTLHGDLPPA